MDVKSRNIVLALGVAGIAVVMLFQTLAGIGPLAASSLFTNSIGPGSASADVLQVSPATQVLPFKSGLATTELEVYSSVRAGLEIGVTPIPDVTCRTSATKLSVEGSATVRVVCTARAAPESGLVTVSVSSPQGTAEAKIYLDSGQ